jgi:hypothetical protein
MTALLRPLQRLFKSPEQIQAGMYHYQSPANDARNYRLHLRMEVHGGGVLIVNASTVLHLNQTAAEYAYYLVQNTPPDEVARLMSARYHVSKAQARQDFLDLAERIQLLVSTTDLDPVTHLDFERQQPFTGEISAPYRLDCALTYRLPDDEPPDAAPIERVARELSTAEWQQVMDKAWNAGIPHVIFTGGEPTLRDDLPELIAHTEALGMVCGLLTDGLRLADELYLGRMLKAGLDHLTVTLQPENEQSWQAVGNAMVEDLAVNVHLTVTAENQAAAPAILERLAGMGVRSLSLTSNDPALAPVLKDLRDKAAVSQLSLVWNLPAPYSKLHPVAFEIDDARMEGAGRAWLYVEPDGDVRPAQGDPKVLGNMLKDNWEKIWKGCE